MTKGIVYILNNPSMPGYVKIGKTRNLQSRLKQLDGTNLPLPFRCIFAIEVDHYDRIEQLAHNAFSHARVRSKREFFEIDEQQVISALMISGGKDVTPSMVLADDQESQEALEKATERRSRFKFSMIGLKKGDVITYIKLPNVTAVVQSETTILFEDEEVSIYRATMTLLHRQGIYWKSVQGQQYWDYEGEILSQMRRRTELE